MKTITIYKTDDGWTFTNQEDALKHENELNKERIFCLKVIENHSYRVDIKAKNKDKALKWFYADPDSYEKYDYEIVVDSVDAIDCIDD